MSGQSLDSDLPSAYVSDVDLESAHARNLKKGERNQSCQGKRVTAILEILLPDLASAFSSKCECVVCRGGHFLLGILADKLSDHFNVTKLAQSLSLNPLEE